MLVVMMAALLDLLESKKAGRLAVLLVAVKVGLMV